jgi:hypothetical protein
MKRKFDITYVLAEQLHHDVILADSMSAYNDQVIFYKHRFFGLLKTEIGSLAVREHFVTAQEMEEE